jgi:hypothetical protein
MVIIGDSAEFAVRNLEGSGEINQHGAYTIMWESQGVFIACDGFVVAGGASFD